MKHQNTKALQLASRFSLPPNALGYCGGENAPNKLLECIKTGNTNDIQKELEKFIVLNPYLKTISEITNKEKFSYEVIEAYCIGNDLIDKFKLEHYEILLKNFLEQGVPDWFVDELRQNPPKNFLPTHLFQVLHVGVGKVSGSVPYNNVTINNCMIRWGEVTNINSNRVKINLQSLDENRKLVKITENIPYSSEITPGIINGDVVAVHWNQVIFKLDQNQIESLSFWTNKILDNI